MAAGFSANRDIKVEASETAPGLYTLRTRGLADRKRPELEIAGVPEAALNGAGGVINMLADYSVKSAEILADQTVGNVLAVGDDGRKLLLVVRAVAAEKPKGGLWSKLTGGGKGVLRLRRRHRRCRSSAHRARDDARPPRCREAREGRRRGRAHRARGRASPRCRARRAPETRLPSAARTARSTGRTTSPISISRRSPATTSTRQRSTSVTRSYARTRSRAASSARPARRSPPLPTATSLARRSASSSTTSSTPSAVRAPRRP